MRAFPARNYNLVEFGPRGTGKSHLFNKLVDKVEIILDSDPRNTTLRGQEQTAGTEERTSVTSWSTPTVSF